MQAVLTKPDTAIAEQRNAGLKDLRKGISRALDSHIFEGEARANLQERIAAVADVLAVVLRPVLKPKARCGCAGCRPHEPALDASA